MPGGKEELLGRKQLKKTPSMIIDHHIDYVDYNYENNDDNDNN